MKKRTCRVYFITHDSGHRTGLLLRTFGLGMFDTPLPSAFGPDEESVLAALETEVARMRTLREDLYERYLWQEQLDTRTIRIDVPPLSAAHGRHVIGSRRIPLRVTYAYSELQGGGFRVMLPRFDAQFVIEDLSLAAEVLRPYLLHQLVGEDPQSLFDLRAQGEEYVREWTPDSARRAQRGSDDDDDDDTQTLRHVSDEYVAQARRGKLARTVGHFPAQERIVRAQGLTPPSLLLVGPPGVGKTAWVRALALSLDAQRAETVKRKLWVSSADRMLSGLPYLGQWQERCIKLVRELEDSGDVLYVDRLLGIVEPQYEGSAIADFFEGPLADGTVCLIAEATEQELSVIARTRATFLSHFEVVRLAEPHPSWAVVLMNSYAESKPGPRLHPSSYRRLLSHLEVFGRDQALPGKAFRFLDWLARTRPEARDDVLYPRDVSRAFAEYSGIPARLLADDEPMAPEAFARELSAKVIGQPHACAVTGRVLARLKSAMTDPARPCATLMFVGPTGVGKTELAKQLATMAFGDARRFLRFDMSEYMYPGSAARLIEVQKGARSLAVRVREEPRSLVLLDEIEKAHPQVLDLLLGALDEGRLTDAQGRAVDMRGTIVVMTSNLGVRDRPAVGFAAGSEEGSLVGVRAHFRPELWNRIDYVVPFRALGRDDVQAIVRLELDKVGERVGFVQRALTLTTSAQAIERLTELGYDPLYGARPLKRVIEERVVAPIAARLAAEPGLRNARLMVLDQHEAAPPGVLVHRLSP